MIPPRRQAVRASTVQQPVWRAIIRELLIGLGTLVLTLQPLALTPGSSVFAAEDPAPQQQLAEINAAIAEIEQWLSGIRQQRTSEEASLAETKADIDQLNQQIADNQQQIASLEQQQQSLNQQQASLMRQSESQRQQIALALKAVYQSGHDSMIKVLLNQQDPTRASRMTHYFRTFHSQQLEQITAWQTTIQQLESTASQLAQNRSALGAANQRLAEQLGDLSARQTQRLEIIAELTEQMLARDDELSALQDDRAELEALVEEINRIIEDIPSPEELMPFAGQKGQMPWPVNGNITARFGDTFAGGQMQRQGVIVSATAGSAVRAVHPGRIVFADWLRGSGHLIVIDHGQGYISVYSHQQSLSKQSGEWVNRGEVIGLSGNDAGNGQPGLYFEIRQQRQPLDPLAWLQAMR
ncbi:murein hydrolase activator EnvC family protein [Pseudohongiella nitratireducens]|uniref:murein hydrolase activator EnvC family protein n=1 Tax=Pseudohongiella nitratireducens TaxID=1768907 RepID=UPI0030ED8F08|tara:strand:- start:493 stop:1725 length:1233 start_codon:yes stop_codon:yes gene_type:complete